MNSALLLLVLDRRVKPHEAEDTPASGSRGQARIPRKNRYVSGSGKLELVMLRKHSFWNSVNTSSRKNDKKNSRRPRRSKAFRSTMLGVESLEDRVVLSADPLITTAFTNQSIDEGSGITVNANFTDLVEGIDPPIGLNPNAAYFDSYVQTALDETLLCTIQFDTTNLTFSGGASGIGTFVTANVTGNPADDFEIAVFIFADFELPDLPLFVPASMPPVPVPEVTAVGHRPLAILSRSDISIAGIIDVSARTGADLTNNFEQVAGPGGGDGGLGNVWGHSPIRGNPTVG